MLIMLPVMLICIYLGVSAFLNVLKNCIWKSFLSKGIIYGTTVFVIILFLYELPGEMEGRKNRITAVEYYIDLMEKYSPDAIMTMGYSFEPYVMSKLSDGLPYETLYLGGVPYAGIIMNNLKTPDDEIHNIIIAGVGNEDTIMSHWELGNVLREIHGPECTVSNIRMLEGDVAMRSIEYAGEYFGSKWDNRYRIFEATVNY